MTTLGTGFGHPSDEVASVLSALSDQLDRDRITNIGFPSTFDFDYTPLWPFFNRVLNNVGDPYESSAFPANTKRLEREVVETFADLLRAPAGDRWGYVTTGGTEGNEYGLLLARTLYPDAMTYYSASAHYSVPKLAGKLRMPAIAVRADGDGCMDLRDLRCVLRAHRDRPAIVVATVGTTMTEAVDEVTAIRQILADVPIRRAYIHADAALSGLPLALLDPALRPGFDLADGADSVSVSGHKFLGSPFPCGVVLARRSLTSRIGSAVDYVAATDTTLGGSRSGHAPLVLWYAMNTFGVEGLRERAANARQVAAHAQAKLAGIGWRATRFPYAFTVVLDAPPEPVIRKWRLATSGGQSHVICMPGVTTVQIDSLVAELAAQRRAVPHLGEPALTSSLRHPLRPAVPGQAVRD